MKIDDILKLQFADDVYAKEKLGPVKLYDKENNEYYIFENIIKDLQKDIIQLLIRCENLESRNIEILLDLKEVIKRYE